MTRHQYNTDSHPARDVLIEMSPRGMEQLIDLIENPPPPNAALVAAHERYLRSKLDAAGSNATFRFDESL